LIDLQYETNYINSEFVAPFLKSVPINMHSSDEIFDFCESLRGGFEEQSIIKLVVLGKGQIGKSTLVNFFKHCNKAQATVFTIILIHFSFLTLFICSKFTKSTLAVTLQSLRHHQQLGLTIVP
jgi:hypothetical protein